MNFFSRISATIMTTADRTAARLENHEAIASLAVERASRAVAEARAVERRHERAGEALVAERTRADADVELWSRRAREHAHGDERTALACLDHGRRATDRAEALVARIADHDAQNAALAQRVAALEIEHAGLMARRDSLSRRETLSRAERVLDASTPSARRIDDALERWETAVDAGELRHRPVAPVTVPNAAPELGARLERAERDRALQAELAALRANVEESRS